MTTEIITKSFDIEGLGNAELLVTYEKTTRRASRTEDCHGNHEFDESEIEFEINRIELVIAGMGIPITPGTIPLAFQIKILNHIEKHLE